MIPINRLLGVLLAALLALSSLPVSSSGQAASVTPVSSSSASDSTKDDVLV
jgi:hypothetical protein